MREVFAVEKVVGLEENLTETRLADGIIFGVEFVKAMKRVAVLKMNLFSSKDKDKFKSTYRVHVQHVNRQIVSREIHRFEHLSQRHLMSGSGHRDNFICVLLQRLLDET